MRAVTFFQWTSHRPLLILALPMILSNITTPLLGMVDTAIVGHMGNISYLAGAAIGSTIITQLYWICGFIRMSATGLSAIARGENNSEKSIKTLYQSTLIGLSLGFIFLLFQGPLIYAGLVLSDASTELANSITSYAHTRIWGAPAALANLALTGWLLGQQKMMQVLVIQVIGNLINISFDLIFVLGLHWQLEGVALASVMAELSITIMSVLVITQQFKPSLFSFKWFKWHQIKPLLGINSDMLIRNIALQVCLAFLVYQGARLGANIAAVNAILMNFLVLTALGLDGIAYGAEALIGESKGQRNVSSIVRQTFIALIWSSIVAMLACLVFTLFGERIVAQMTNLQEVKNLASQFMPYIIMLPLVAHWCFLFDGIFIGLAKAKAMRNTMLISTLGIFFPCWWWLKELGNDGLWIATLVFMAARGVSLGGYFYHLYTQKKLLD